MSERIFVVVDVGCIECGASTHILSAHRDGDEARAAVRAFALERDDPLGDDESGDHYEYFVGEQRSVVVLPTDLASPREAL